jgi:hypothetical protein
MLRLMLILVTVTLLGCTATATPAPKPAPQPPAIPTSLVDQTRVSTSTYGFKLFVQEGAYLMWERANQETDAKTRGYVFSTYETVSVPKESRVRIIQDIGQRVQVEVIDGPMQGRRGWMNRIFVQ